MTQTTFETAYQEIFPFWEEIPASDRAYICQHSLSLHYPK